VRARKIDIIVVYKVDRLTRSLADFAKLVELFDAHDVSFVSVTQQFNTTTSMGRLTLNVLLSFAQFEREVTSERIRDKIAASKRKGIWVGGPLPLGYALKDGELVVVADEAERVRLIFRRYLEVSGINELARDLKAKNICTRARTLRTTGNTRGGIPFGRKCSGAKLPTKSTRKSACVHRCVAIRGSLWRPHLCAIWPPGCSIGQPNLAHGQPP
jgi:site-specific DNA recombinase